MPNKCWCGNENLIDYSDEYYKCNLCHSLVSKKMIDDSITHIKNEESDFYGKNYWEEKMLHLSGLSSINELIDNYLKERSAYWLKYLLKYILPGTSIAEIGCGIGQFPYLIKQAGYQQKAFELSKYICDYSSKELNINISNTVIDNCSEKFDAILAYDLIEHLLNPENFIKGLIDKLKYNGILCFQTPCYDESITYEEMLIKKPRFQQLLVSNEHIFIFSKKSIEKLLQSLGICHIHFEPAFFGDDYDMFLFASRNPLKLNSEKEIDEALNGIENGRIIKALISLFDEKKELTKKLISREYDAKKRLEDVNILTKQLQKTESDSKKRLENIEKLTKQLKETRIDSLNRLKNIEILENQLVISEKDRKDRLDVINNQNMILLEKDKEIQEKEKEIQEKENEINIKANNIQLLEADINQKEQLIYALELANRELLSEKDSLKSTIKNLKRLLFHK